MIRIFLCLLAFISFCHSKNSRNLKETTTEDAKISITSLRKISWTNQNTLLCSGVMIGAVKTAIFPAHCFRKRLSSESLNQLEVCQRENNRHHTRGTYCAVLIEVAHKGTVIGITQPPPREVAWSALFSNLSKSALDNYVVKRSERPLLEEVA